MNIRKRELQKTIKLLEAILEKKICMVTGARKLYALYRNHETTIGNPFISKYLGLGLSSQFDDFPAESEYHLWNAESLKRQLEELKNYETRFYETVIMELEEIKNGN